MRDAWTGTVGLGQGRRFDIEAWALYAMRYPESHTRIRKVHLDSRWSLMFFADIGMYAVSHAREGCIVWFASHVLERSATFGRAQQIGFPSETPSLYRMSHQTKFPFSHNMGLRSIGRNRSIILELSSSPMTRSGQGVPPKFATLRNPTAHPSETFLPPPPG